MSIIALSGTHGTSKTTLLYLLAHTLKKKGINTVVLNELARECPLPINQKATEETQVWLFATQIKTELELLDKYDLVLTDRACLDCLIYGQALGFNDIISSLMPYAIKHVEKYYKHIFLLDPLEFNYFVVDGVRDQDPDWRLKIHVMFEHVYTKYDIPHALIHTDKELFKEVDRLYGD